MKRSLFLLLCIFSPIYFFSQDAAFGKGKVSWLQFQRDSLKEFAKKFPDEDLVILYDYVSFNLTGRGTSRMIKNTTFKVNTIKGVEKLSSVRYPESFDFHDLTRFEQGHRKYATPFVQDYNLVVFDAWVISESSNQRVPFEHHRDRFKRTKRSGENFQDQAWRFNLSEIHIGDIIQISYEATFQTDYRDNLFYFHSDIAKVLCEYTVDYSFREKFRMSEFTKAVNIPDTLVKTVTGKVEEDAIHQTKTIRLRNLPAINYPKNSFQGEVLPHLYVDMGAYPVYQNGEWTTFKPLHFDWVTYPDTVNNFKTAYTAQYAGLRKFTKQLPEFNNDEGKGVFLTALCDSLNNCRYISSHDLFYKESELYNIFRGDHLLKKRIVQHHVFDIITDVMNERKIFYYLVTIHDRRYSRENAEYNIHSKYESNLYAIPVSGSLVYMMPRYFGVKYFINEIPFYFENTAAILRGRNFTEDMHDRSIRAFNMVNTPATNQNVNIRSQISVVKVKRDSLKADVSEKLNLSGQFSTILRHHYLNESIDSSISLYYFRKCTDKPMASKTKIRNTASSHVFPFKQTFTTTEQVAYKEKDVFGVQQWFAFPFDKRLATEVPNHDYYVDFLFTDTYSFLFEFNEPTTILNAGDFAKKINNDYFAFESDIMKNEDQTYLMRVRLVVKQKMIPKSDLHLLTEMAVLLEKMNNFSLQLSKKP